MRIPKVEKEDTPNILEWTEKKGISLGAGWEKTGDIFCEKTFREVKELIPKTTEKSTADLAKTKVVPPLENSKDIR